jgi:hypothetical protein
LKNYILGVDARNWTLCVITGIEHLNSNFPIFGKFFEEFNFHHLQISRPPLLAFKFHSDFVGLLRTLTSWEQSYKYLLLLWSS